MKQLLYLGLATAMSWLAASSKADELRVQFDELLCGGNGDSDLQFIEIRLDGAGQNLWGPQDGETEGRARLVFFDVTGSQTNEYVFPSDPPIGPTDPVHGGSSVLIMTQALADLPGMPAPDFVIDPLLLAGGAKVCFTGNPDNVNGAQVNLCLSYGAFVGDTETDTIGQPAGAPAAAPPITDATSLQRFQNFENYATGQFNADFALAEPAARNSVGSTGSINVLAAEIQGETLFLKETFLGNKRTCSTCHRPEESFGLTPGLVAALPADDPLFVAEFDPNLAELEDPCLMHSPRVLILENVDGFENPHVFRGSPSLLNVALTAPYGLGGNFENLREFAIGAVRQHFPKTMARNEDPIVGPIDFRIPTEQELLYLEAFMQSISLPADGDFDLDRMIDSAVERGFDRAFVEAGRDIFFGTGKCFNCHNGPVLADTDEALGGGGNRNFDTGVVNQDLNDVVECLDGPLPSDGGGAREFNTPQLIGIGSTGPFFHDSSADTLLEVINFYRGFDFTFSPGGALVGTIVLNGTEAAQLTTFLEALAEPNKVHNLTHGTGFFTIQEAINAATGGNEIVVDPGTYAETLDFLGKDILLRSLDPANPDIVSDTVIDGGALGTCVVLSSGELAGFTIQNGAQTSGQAAGVHASGSAIVSHNVITGHVSSGTGAGGVTALDDALVQYNFITNNESLIRAGGVEAQGQARVVGNVISANSSAGPGGAVWASGSAEVRHNTMTANSSASGMASVQAEGGAVITHNIIVSGPQGWGIELLGGEVSADYNAVFGHAEGDYLNTLPGGHDVQSDPMLASDGVHLLPGSPCFNVGDAGLVPDPAETDIDGQARGAMPPVDIGADEQYDCNGNGIDDFDDIGTGSSSDCNANSAPDECDPDGDGDGAIDACDGCPDDPLKSDPGDCGCGQTDLDSDLDGTADCIDGCPDDPGKIDPGVCGCGLADSDSDGDGSLDCVDLCPDDPDKDDPGICGCGLADVDLDMDGVMDCIDPCDGNEQLAFNCLVHPTNGKVFLRVGLLKANAGTTVTFRLDADPLSDVVITVNTQGRAGAKFVDIGPGSHTVEVVECGLSQTGCE